MLINNILQNAAFQVRISITQETKNVLLFVEDDGEGIPESEREQILKPFVRGSRAESSQGYGMGLAISKRIAEWHGGDLLVLRSNVLGGAKIQVTLPGKPVRGEYTPKRNTQNQLAKNLDPGN